MARKRTLSTLDTSIAYEAVGLDLAKEDVALAAFDSEHKEPYLIDRISYPKSRRKTPRNPVGSRSFKLKVRETHGLFY